MHDILTVVSGGRAECFACLCVALIKQTLLAGVRAWP